MERDRRRAIRDLSVDKDWCGQESARGVGEDWCASEPGGSDGHAGAYRDWCGTDAQSSTPDEIGALLARFSPLRRRS